MTYEVIAVCVRNGHVMTTGVKGADAEGRKHETVDTATNVLFSGCKGPWDVEDTYEAFWNRLNDSWERHFPSGKERVKVLSVTEIG